MTEKNDLSTSEDSNGRTGSDRAQRVIPFERILERTVEGIQDPWLLFGVAIVLVLGAVALLGTGLLSEDLRFIVGAILFVVVLVAIGNFIRRRPSDEPRLGQRDRGDEKETSSQEKEHKSPLSNKRVKRPWIAVSDLENRGRESDERSFGVSSYLRRILEEVKEEYPIQVYPISHQMGFDSDVPLSKVRKDTGARFMLKGALDLRGDPCALEVELWRTEDEIRLWRKEIVEPWKNIQSTTKRIAEFAMEQVLMQTRAPEATIAEVKNKIRDIRERNIEVFEWFNRGIFKQNRFNNLRQDDDFRDANYYLKKAVESSNSNSLRNEALAQLGFLYILGWETIGDPKWLRESQKKWEQILENTSDSPDPFAKVELGYVSYVSGSKGSTEAIRLAREAVNSDPEHAIAHNVLALLYLYLGYYESNITIEKTEVFGRLPTYVYPRTNAALAQQLLGEYSEALKFAKQARDIQREAFVANLLVGAQYFYMDRLDAADRVWREGLDHCPKSVAGILEVALAWVRAREGNISPAQQTLRANVNAPWLPGPYGPYYSSLAALVGEHEKAITLLEKDSTFAKSYRYLVSEPTLESLKDDPRFHSLLEKRYEEWIRNLSELEAGLPNPPEFRLPSPEEFLSK